MSVRYVDFVSGKMESFAKAMGYERVLIRGSDYSIISGKTVGELKRKLKNLKTRLVIVNLLSRAALSWCASSPVVVAVRLDPRARWKEKDVRIAGKPLVLFHRDIFDPVVLYSMYGLIRKSRYLVIISDANSATEIRAPRDIIRALSVLGARDYDPFVILSLLDKTGAWSDTAARWAQELVGTPLKKLKLPLYPEFRLKRDRKRYLGIAFLKNDISIHMPSPKMIENRIREFFGKMAEIHGLRYVDSYRNVAIVKTTVSLAHLTAYVLLGITINDTSPVIVGISGTIKSLSAQIDSFLERTVLSSQLSRQPRQSQQDPKQ